MKILVIVDVQKQFNKFIQHDLIDELSNYCENFDKVFQIWDTHNNVKPSESFPKEEECIPKKFGKNCFSPAVKSFIQKIEDSTEEGKVFSLKNDNGYIIRVDNNHDWFYINPEIVKLINDIKNDDVTLVGGAEGECLEDVYQTFLAFDVNTIIDHKYTYSAKTKNSDTVENTKGDWKESKFECVKTFSEFLNENINYTEKYYVPNDYVMEKGDFYLRFTDEPFNDLKHKYSRWYMDDNELEYCKNNDLVEGEDYFYDEDSDKYYKLHSGLSGHHLESDNLEDAINEVYTKRNLFKNPKKDNWSIFECDDDIDVEEDTPEGNSFYPYKVLYSRIYNIDNYLTEKNNDEDVSEEICVIVNNYDELVKLNDVVKKYTNDNRVLDKSNKFFDSSTIYIMIELEDYWVNVYTNELTKEKIISDKEFDYVYDEIYTVKNDLDLIELSLKNHIVEPIELIISCEVRFTQ